MSGREVSYIEQGAAANPSVMPMIDLPDLVSSATKAAAAKRVRDQESDDRRGEVQLWSARTAAANSVCCAQHGRITRAGEEEGRARARDLRTSAKIDPLAHGQPMSVCLRWE